MEKANEIIAFKEGKGAEDKALFVKNLGWLLSQTGEDIDRCEYSAEQDVVSVFSSRGILAIVNVRYDSYAAIARDVLKAIM